MKLSVSSFVYLNYPLEEAVDRIADAGYQGIDIWGGRPHAYRRDLTPSEIHRLSGRMRDRGLAVPSFIPAQFRYPTSLCSAFEKVRKDSVAYIEESLESAAQFDAPVVSVCPGHSLFGQTTEDAIRRLAESLHEICSAARPLGLRVAVEPADQFETDLLNSCADALALVDEVGMENLGVVLDNGHSHVVGESADGAISKLGDRLFHVHIDDNDGLRDQHLIPGDGDFDFTPFISALRDANYDGFLTAELSWDYTIDPDRAVRATRERLDEMLGAVDEHRRTRTNTDL